jgi:RNA polymerase sigma factor (sigma-70 family)
MTADAELLRRYLLDRDDAVFAAIVRKHGPMVFAACRRIAPNRPDAEDAFQATFLVLATRAESVRPHSQLGAWLHGVAVRCGKKARDAARRFAGSPLPELPARFASSPEPDLPAVIDDALASIPHSYRAAVVLCHLEGRTRAEAAKELGWSEGTLSGRLHRALKLLGERLTAKGVTAAGAVVIAVLSARPATASVPLPLIASTCSAAGLVSAGFAEPGPAHSLACGVLRAMTFRKLKLTAVALGVVGLGAFTLLGRLDAKPTDPPAAKASAEKKPAWKELVKVEQTAGITCVDATADHLAVGDEGGGLVVWETKTGKEVRTVMKPPKKNTQPVTAVRFVGTVLFVSSHDGAAVFSGDVTDPKDTFGGVMGKSRYLGFSGDGQTWVEQDRPAMILLRHNIYDNAWRGEPAVIVREPDGKEIKHTALSADDKVFATASDVPVVRVFDRETNRETHKITLKEGLTLSALKLSDDGKRLAVVGEKGFAKVFDADNGAELCELTGHAGTVAAVAFTPDGQQVATADGKTVRVFDAKSGKTLSEWAAHTDDVTCLAFTPDGKKLVTGSKDKSAKVWERE